MLNNTIHLFRKPSWYSNDKYQIWGVVAPATYGLCSIYAIYLIKRSILKTKEIKNPDKNHSYSRTSVNI